MRLALQGQLEPGTVVTMTLLLTRLYAPLTALATARLDIVTALVSFERQIHGFVLMGRVIDEANIAVQLCAAQLKQALSA